MKISKFSGKLFKKGRGSPEVVEPEENKTTRFQVIEGGKAQPAGKEPPSDNWLSGLHPNTNFLARHKKSYQVQMDEYTVVAHSEKCVQLKVVGVESPIWVDPQRFCNNMELVDILYLAHDDTE